MQPQRGESLTMGRMKDTQDQHFFKVGATGQENQNNHKQTNEQKTQTKKTQTKPSPDKETKNPFAFTRTLLMTPDLCKMNR